MKYEKEDRLTVKMDGDPIYDIVLTDSFGGLSDEIVRLGCENKKLCIVTDSNVAELYLNEVQEILSSCCASVTSFVIPAGEENKNLDVVRTVYEHLILNHYERRDMLVALGGGVVGDLCGFTAATYLRGVDFIQIPTTLLAQVDSSIGGKTGVDFDAYKNMVGAFHMPKLVYTNVSVLATLPPEQFSAGMGEVIKHGLIRDRDYYDWIGENREKIKAMDPDTLHLLVQASNYVKREVVEIDPTEQNERALLNFGHTLGHAIEKRKDFSMLHGHCVGVGALAAMKISEKRGKVSPDDVAGYEKMLSYFDMPVRVSGIDTEAVIEDTKNDKKMESGVIKFILLDGVGNAYIDRSVTVDDMREALDFITEDT